MATIRGIHCLAHGDKAEARQIALDIQQHQRLLVGTNSVYGAGAYAWYIQTIPLSLRLQWPQVLFEIDEQRVVPVCKRDGTPLGFFRIPGPIGNYVQITVLEFANLW